MTPILVFKTLWYSRKNELLHRGYYMGNTVSAPLPRHPVNITQTNNQVFEYVNITDLSLNFKIFSGSVFKGVFCNNSQFKGAVFRGTKFDEFTTTHSETYWNSELVTRSDPYTGRSVSQYELVLRTREVKEHNKDKQNKFINTSFENAKFSECLFIHAVFERSNFDNANMEKAHLGFKWSGAANGSLVFVNCSFKNTHLKGSHLKGQKFERCNFEGADLSHAQLEGAIFDGANLQKAKLWGITGYGGNSLTCLLNYWLIGRNIETRFQGSNLREANLRYSDLRYVKFNNANLEGADLGGADLRYADFSNANLKNVIINTETLLDGIILVGATVNWIRRDEPKLLSPSRAFLSSTPS